MTLFLVQALNGLQLGVLLFLIAAGLTLVFGVMDLINLAHGVQYMLGAYLAVIRLRRWTGSFGLALLLAVAGSFVAGLAAGRGSCSGACSGATTWTRCSRPTG